MKRFWDDAALVQYGEEFGILLPHTDLAGAYTVAECLRCAIEEAEIESAFGVIKITASFGVAQTESSDFNIRALLDRADSQLYEAKRNGRNCVRAHTAAVAAANLRLATA